MAQRSTAEQRREQAIAVGMKVFADHGLTTSAIAQVADEIGVSQPYVFRLFGSKQAFFLVCLDEMENRVRAVFRAAAQAGSGDPIETMGAGFRELTANGVISGFWIQASAAARKDEEIAARCRLLIVGVLEEAERLTGASADELARFLANGVLVMVLQALGVDLSRGSGPAVELLRTSRAAS